MHCYRAIVGVKNSTDIIYKSVSFLSKDQNSVTRNSNSNIKFSSKAIRKALQSLEPSLGRATIEAITYELEFYGLLLENDREYSIAEIKLAIEKIFGEAAPLFLERFTRALFAVTD